MRKKRLMLIAFGTTALMGLPLTAQQPPQDVQQIFDRMTQAFGWDQAAKIRSVEQVGTISYPAQKMQGKFTILYKLPDKMLVRMQIQGLGEMVQGYDGKVAWEKNPVTGVRELRGAELEQIRSSARRGAAYDMRKLLRNPRLVGRQRVDSREAFVIAGEMAAGMPVKIFVDASTYLLLSVETTVASSRGNIKATVRFEDYRKVDGIMYPFVIRQSGMGVESVMRTERVRHNISIDDAVFRKPKS